MGTLCSMLTQELPSPVLTPFFLHFKTVTSHTATYILIFKCVNGLLVLCSLQVALPVDVTDCILQVI